MRQRANSDGGCSGGEGRALTNRVLLLQNLASTPAEDDARHVCDDYTLYEHSTYGRTVYRPGAAALYRGTYVQAADHCICNESAGECKTVNPRPIRIVKVAGDELPPPPPPPPPPPSAKDQHISCTKQVRLSRITSMDRPDVCGEAIYGPSYRPGSIHDMLCKEPLSILERPI